ncbi:bifunctional heptose 7-phosphate kinase/heptose 1-phosphate adenyltransferase [Dactylosporangium sp. CA-092794]|uniref:bifunctional heptose 7-phosphate kinase/heptose 1-phosphate adenyltransferase n=1 Tax=Dactylosporangium sp. CA-092794 TaxID=3239929 RepID=UPI003D93B142
MIVAGNEAGRAGYRRAVQSSGNFAALAEGWRDAAVLVVGDALLDGWLCGTPTRLSSEAPVPVITLDTTREVCGGAANTAANFAALGARTTLVGAVGDDDAGARLRTCVWDGGVADRMVTAVGRHTVTKRRVVADNYVLVRFDDGDTSPLGPDAVETLVRRLEEALSGDPRPDAVVVCDHGIGTLGPQVRALLGDRRLELPLLAVDAHDLASWASIGPDLVTPNRDEADRVLGREPGRVAFDRQRDRGRLLRHTGAAVVAVTLDQEGSAVMSLDGESVGTAAPPARGAHATGAGGAYLAGFVLARLAGAGLVETADVAQRCASMAIRSAGTAVVPEKMGVLQREPA